MRGKSRRPAREAILRALYEIEVGRQAAADAIADTLEHSSLSPDLAAFAEEAILGVLAHRPAIDKAIAGSLKGWELSRVAVVDRNVLRLATYELFHRPSIPPAVTINEAVSLAKKYSTAESGRFVNGVLGALVTKSPKAQWDPTAVPPDEDTPAPEPEPTVEIETVEAGSEQAEELARTGAWQVRREDSDG